MAIATSFRKRGGVATPDLAFAVSGAMQVRRSAAKHLAVLVLALSLSACGGHGVSAADKHARAACAHWAKINAGINDTAQRTQESMVFQQEATAAATANAKYKPLQAAAESWNFAESSPTTPDSVDALRAAIDQSRAACAGVPSK
jgi:hypothetical protein